jgi:hypothetical protein
MALSGCSDSTLSFRILPSSFHESFKITCPPWVELKGPKLGGDVLTIAQPPETQPKIRVKGFLPIPPLATDTIMSSKSMEAHDLTIAFELFDQTFEVIKACTLLCPIIFFLYGIVHQKIKPTLMLVTTSAREIHWSSSIHAACISKPKIQTLPLDVDQPQPNPQ